MRSVVGALIVIAALAGSSAAEDIYRWKDSAGGLHFANAPTPNPTTGMQQHEGSGSGSEATAAAETPPADVIYDDNGNPMEAAPAKKRLAPDEVSDYSTDVSMRRTQLERELKSTESRLKSIDGHLATLQQVRTKNARGSAATGGVGAPANVLSPEEEELVEERDELAQHAVELRNDAAELRQEVEARLGSVPTWWTDLR
jgi:hypothetical protein